MIWIKPKTIVGPPAEGAVYLRRPEINNEFWDKTKSGAHIVFTAPRRVGKSSIMKDLAENPPKDYVAVYQNIESDKNHKEFFKRLFMLIIEQIDAQKKIVLNIRQWVKTRRIGEFTLEGKIKLEKEELDYKEELLSLIEKLGKEKIHVVMLLDEFPEVIHSIMKKEGASAAAEILHTLRSIRHDEKFKKFTFVFAGSIGLDHIVATIDRPKLINDLVPVHIGPLTKEEANKLLTQLLDGATMQFNNEAIEYLLKKISYLLPFYVQLMIEKCNEILDVKKSPHITIQDIDSAFELGIKEGRNFDDWESRINRYLNRADAKYCIAILTRCAHNESYTIQESYNLSKNIIPETGYKQLLDNVLVKDGYLHEHEKDQRYFFLSPFLKEWWKKRHPIFEIED